MKIEALTASPDQLVTAIDKLMIEGGLETWKIVKSQQQTIFYTHTPDQWNEKALISRFVGQDRVVFAITYWKGLTQPTIADKGVYFGRFTEVLLVHFREYFSKLEVFV
jgi:hypothetical protein